MSAWDEVRGRIEAGDAGGVVELAGRLTAADRRAVAKELPRYLREIWTDPTLILDRKLTELVRVVRVAGAVCMGGAAATAAWLCRAEMRPWFAGDNRLITRAVADRPAEWRAEVGRRIASRLRPTDLMRRRGDTWVLAAELTKDAGADPPTDDAFVLGWVMYGTDRGGASDPFFDALVPRIFEADGVGRVLQWEVSLDAWQPSMLLSTLTRLAAEGRLKREMLLDGCVRRFLRGGVAVDLKWFVALHRALEPTLEEVTVRVGDYVRLLPAVPGPVAEFALEQIRRVDDAAPLEETAFTEAAEAVLFRAEKKLVRAAMTWLDRTARKRDRVDRTLRALTVAFACEAFDLRERAVAIAVKHASRAGGDARRAVAEAAGGLPAELRARVAAEFGSVGGPAAAPRPAEVPPPPAPRELPPPISTPAELAEAVVTAFGGAAPGWPSVERVLAGLVTLTHADPERTRAALERAVPAGMASWIFDDSDPWEVYSPHLRFASVVRAAMRPARSVGRKVVRSLLTGARAVRQPVPESVIARRVQAARDAVGRCPVLLATPTAASGHIDPEELIARLRLLEKAGVEPAAIDLEQALLRLPRDVDASVLAAARQVATRAGGATANWLATGGLPDPTVTCVTATGWRTSRVVLATVSPARGASGIAAELCRLSRADAEERIRVPYYGRLDGWPAVMPSHPEVIAAHLLPYLAGFFVEARAGQAAALLALAESGGPAGAATAAALVYGFGARRREERAAAVDALLILAGSGRLPARELGEVIATLVRHDAVKLNRVTAAMTDAARAGAHAEVWTAIAAALPGLLAALPVLRGERRTNALPGMPDLLALATESAESAESAGGRAEIPGLAAVAAGGGSSRLVREAARLHRRLNDQPSAPPGSRL